MPSRSVAFALIVSTASLAAQTPSAAQEDALAAIAAAYGAKVAASALFVSGRTLQSVLEEELAADTPRDKALQPIRRFEIDLEGRCVTCTVGQHRATAVATGNLGCTLATDAHPVARLRERGTPAPPNRETVPASVAWPQGDRLDPAAFPAGVDRAGLARTLDAAFTEPASGPRVRTRAVVVVHRNQVVAERYADGYRADMPLPGWSMTKSVIVALVGVRIGQGKLDLAAPLPVPEWPKGDARTALRLPDLLAMASGLRWNEDYLDPGSDVLRMLFTSDDHAAVQTCMPSLHPPGSRFLYSSGTTNLVCRILRTTFAEDREYWAFPRQCLFEPLCMRTACIETDPSGTFVGSSYGFASARDWARFGMLWANGGMCNGTRIVASEWLSRCAAPTPSSGGRFGLHVWRDVDPDGSGPREREWQDLPEDLLHFDGHEGQYVVVVPSRALVVVRLGCTKSGGFGLHALVRGALAACTGK